MRAHEILSELQLPKQQWVVSLSNADKLEAGDELVDLVKTAYSKTPQGSFVNSIKDVVPSDWNVLDWDQDPDVDACVFYRGPRAGERWTGYKIQGIGHDGASQSKSYVINKIQNMLQQPGVWIESSDAMRATLKKLNAPIVTDEQLLKRLFNDPDLQMVNEDTYTRKIGNLTVTESVFGNPKLK